MLLVCVMVISMATSAFATEVDQVELTEDALVVSEEIMPVSEEVSEVAEATEETTEEATEATEEATEATEEATEATEEATEVIPEATEEVTEEIPEATEEITADEQLSDEALLAAAPTGANMSAAGMKIISKTVNSVAPGVSYDKLIVRNSANQQNMGIMTKIDLTQSVKLKTGYKGYYTANSTAATRATAASKLPWGMQAPTDVAAAYASIADAEGTVVMTTNADYFNMGTGEPNGYLIMEGNAIKATGEPYFAILKDGTAVIRDAGVDHSDVVEAFSGPFYLVKDGKNVAPADPSQMPRNSVGICDDGSVVFFQNDGRQAPKSVGMSLPEMAAVLLDAGCHTALYLDGGGSASVSARKEGAATLEVINSPSDGQERDVSSCVMIVSTAKATGEFDHAAITPNDELYTPKSKVQFSATGVDTAGTAVEIPADVTWALADACADMGSIDENGLFTANEKTGIVTVEMRRGGKCVGSAFVEIVSPDAIYFENDEISLGFEETTDFKLVVRYQDRDVHIKNGDIVWTITNEKMGTFDGNLFTASDGESLNGEVTATSAYNAEVKGTIKVIVGMLPTIVWDFEDVVNEDNTVTDAANYYLKENGGILSSSNYGRGGKQSIEIVSIDDGEPVRFGEKSMKLNYDFTQCGEVTEGAVIGTSESFTIPGTPTGIGVWVYAPEGVGIDWERAADGSTVQAGFWLRGYIKDSSTGGAVPYDFTFEPKAITEEMAAAGVQPGIDWEGWKYCEANLTHLQAPYTILAGNTFRLMYVAGTKMGTKTANSIYFDNLQFVYGTNVDDIDEPKVDSISVANKELVDGSELTTSKISLRTTFSDVQNKYTSGVDASTIRMYIDGVNVVDNDNYNFALNANDGYAELYDLELLDGQHSVTVSLRDKFGNDTEETRFFTVKTGKAAPAVTVVPAEGSAILSDKVILEVRATETGIKKLENTIRLSNRFPAPEVTFSEAYTGTHSYNKTNHTLTISAELKPTAPLAAAEEGVLIAEIAVDVPADLTENDTFLYEVKSGSYTTADDKFYTYAAGESTLPVDAEVIISCDPILVGGPKGILKVTDQDGKPVAGAKFYLAADNTEIGAADENGVWETDYFSAAAATTAIYAKNADGMPSFHYNVFSYEGSGAADAAPTKIQFNAVSDSTSQKNISWMSNPLTEGAQSIRYRVEGTEEWTTKEASTKLLTFTTGGNTAANINSVTLTGLNPAATYEYQVGAGELWSETATMEVAAASGSTKFFVISDIQGGDMANVKALVSDIEKGGYNFGIQTGDAIDSVTSYSQVAGAVDLLGKDILDDMDMVRVLGNHEYYGDPNGDLVSALYNVPNTAAGTGYSVTYGDVYVATIHFTNSNAELKAALDWLVKDAKASDATWKVLSMHQPPYYTNAVGGNKPIYELVPDACEEAGIDVVFSGHDHALARTNQLTDDAIDKENGILYYIGGSCGEKSYPISSQGDFDYKTIFAFDPTVDFNAIYIGVEANALKMTLTIYDVAADGTQTVRDVYTLLTETGKCDAAGHKLDEAVYDRAAKKVICNNCKMAVDAVAADYTDWATDKETGRKMYLISGKPQTGAFIFGEETYYFDNEGVAYQGKVKLDEVELEFNNGLIVGGHTGFLKKADGKLYHYVNGAMTHGWLEADGSWYYMDQVTGAALVGKGVIPDDFERLRDARYDFDKDGKLVSGYFNKTGIYYWAGKPLSRSWVKNPKDSDPDAWYATNEGGHFVTDGSSAKTVQYMVDGVVYTFDNSNGKLLKGGFGHKDGKIYYYWAGVASNDGWFEVDGAKYYAFEDGHLATGSHNIDNEAYMFTSSGKLVTEGVILTAALNKDSSKMTVTVSGAEDIDSLRLAIWPANGEQSLTLEWFDAELNKDKEWVVVVPMCTYNRADIYNIHAYATTDGERSMLVASTFEVAKAVDHKYNEHDFCSICGAVLEKEIPMYRLYNPYTLEHLLTSDDAERDMLLNAGWTLDGIAWSSPNVGQPVYRLYNPYDDWHTYTMSQEEIDTLLPLGWKIDGIVCCSATKDNGKVIYRMFNPYEKKNYHLLTASDEERALLENAGWKLDGGAWYCLAD